MSDVPVPNAPAYPKPRLLVVSATYVTEENRKKLVALSRYFDVTCATCAEHAQYGLYNCVDPAQPPAEYRLIGLTAVGDPASTTRYWLRGLGRVFREHPVDVVLVESEPWAWVRWQSWFWKTIYQRQALFGEYSAENLERHGLKGRILDLFYRAAVRSVDFVAICNRAGGEIYKRRGLLAEQLLVAPQLGVDDTLFHPVDAPTRARLREEAGIPPDCFLIGFCGRLVESKGVLDLLAAVRRLRQMPSGLNIHLSILGTGPLKENLAVEPGAASFLHLLPARKHDGVAPYMQMLDLFVLPSKPEVIGQEVWEEQFGYVLIQAMACGIPTVGSDSGAIPEVIDTPAATFPASDIAALTARLSTLIADSAVRAALARCQREQTLRRYANERLGAIWANFIRRWLPPPPHS